MTLELVRSKGYPYPDFADDDESYARARLFWSTAFDEAVGTAAAQWRPWMSDPFRDGHPIVSMVNEALGRGVLLQLVVEGEDPDRFKCWMSQTIDGDGRALPYLGIETFISIENRDEFRALVAKWTEPRTSHATMVALVEAHRRTDA